MTGSLATHTLAGRAELLRILAEEDESLREAAARQFGFKYSRRPPEPKKSKLTDGQTTTVAQIGSGGKDESASHESSFWQPAPVQFWRPETFRLTGDGQQRETREQRQKRLNPSGQIVPPPRPDLSTMAETLPVIRPLSPVHGVTTRLRAEVLTPQPAGIDLDKVVSRLSRGEFLQHLPHRMHGVLARGFSVWMDRSIRLTPYWDDQTLVTLALLRLLPHDGTNVAMLSEGDRRLTVEYPEHLVGQVASPNRGTTVIVLGDLGGLQVRTRQATRFWIEQGFALRNAGCRAVAVVPCDRTCIASDLARLWKIIPWDPAAVPGSDESRKANVDRLLGLLAHARRIEPGLIRDLRRLLPEGRNCPGLEAALWQNSALSSRHSEAATLDLRVLTKLRERFDNEPEWLKEEVADLLRHWRPQLASIWCEEGHSLLAGKSPELLPEAEKAEIARFFTQMADWAEKNPRQSQQFSHVFGWLNRTIRRSPGLARGHSPAAAAMHRIAALVCADDPTVEPLDGMHPEEIPPPGDVEFAASILITGQELRFERQETIRHDAKLGTLATIRSRNGRIAVRSGPKPQADESCFSIERNFWASGEAPDWAADWGIDEFGLWVELWISQAMTSFVGRLDELPDTYEKQRMRWVPAGKFVMGSPKDEPGRYGDEGPQHEVTITTGFWMFDTPCTQAFYQTVTGANPSEFKTPDRPVETVSWKDAQHFLEQLRSLEPGIEIGLPTEAEWEYACRAGTTEATYAGPIEIIGVNNAPALDPVAWYGGNCGVDFDLENGTAAAWPEKQFKFDKGGARRVRMKLPNPRGLYDMLGNVYEWCDDGRREYSETAEHDPRGPSAASASRVFRGGGWSSRARLVRAACRVWSSPEDRDHDLGFRCRVRGAEPSQGASERAIKQARAGKGGSPERAVSGRSERSRGDRSPASGERPTASGPAIEQTTWIQLIDRHEATTPVPAGPVAKIVSDVEELTLWRIPRPDWAAAIGRDEFGLWADLKTEGQSSRDEGSALSRNTASALLVRLRWIPPGRFTMGSPKGEPGRWDEGEFEPHPVVIPLGFWLFETPVTQALWEQVMGADSNKSQFRSADRPVEHVSWHDCRDFCSTLSGRTGLLVALPTEAEWEYACRAGTTEATYAGPIEILGDANAPVLDDIAWYGGNSNVGFELDNGVELSWSPADQRQHGAGPSGTHPVRRKAPNPWGLYDMLGNVYEWCSDVGRKPSDTMPDKVDEASAFRVIRGGGWSSFAQDGRAACRNGVHPGGRGNSLGFRCRVREFQPGEESPDSVSAEQS